MIPGRGLKDIRTPIGALASRDGCTPLKARTKLMSLQVEKNHLEKEVKRMSERLEVVNARLKEIKELEARLFPLASRDSTSSGNGEKRLPGLPTGNERPLSVKERLMSF